MYAIELNGTDIGKKVRITYRFQSWKKERADETIELVLVDIHHKRDGRIFINKSTRVQYIPYTATVEVVPVD